jgi:hypothetical protein
MHKNERSAGHIRSSLVKQDDKTTDKTTSKPSFRKYWYKWDIITLWLELIPDLTMKDFYMYNGMAAL